MHSSPMFSAAGAASRGVLRTLSPSSGAGKQGPSHASPIVNLVNGGAASCGPARLNAGLLPA